MNRRYFSVYQVNRYIKSILDEDIILTDIFVEGEISNFKYHPSGHMYFSLKDAYAQLSCVMFRSYAENIGFMPENGMRAIVSGNISVYEKTGQYQLYAEKMEPFGKGALYLSFEQLKQKLSDEGLFDASRKKAIPRYPRCVAVITSGSGAAVRDIMQIMNRRNKTVKIVVVPTLVQGERAPQAIADSLRLVNQWGGADCIILGRGGGSIEDLQAFNDEITARAVAESHIPVVSAVGHETDYTITDFIADLRAPTPSAAAELLTPVLSELQENLQYMLDRLCAVVNAKMARLKSEMQSIAVKKAFADPLYFISLKRESIASCFVQLNKEMNRRLATAQMELDGKISLLESLSPLNVLKRGYTCVSTQENLIITSIAMLKPEQSIKLKFYDGEADAVVERIRQSNDKENG